MACIHLKYDTVVLVSDYSTDAKYIVSAADVASAGIQRMATATSHRAVLLQALSATNVLRGLGCVIKKAKWLQYYEFRINSLSWRR